MNDPIAPNPYAAPTAAIEVNPAAYGRTYSRCKPIGYTFLAVIVYQIILAVLGAAWGLGGTPVGAGNGTVGISFILLMLLLMLVYFVVLFYIASRRLVNIGSNPWWCLGLIVPLLNIFVGVRCLVCPEGYNDHKTLDTPAKIILGFAITAILLGLIAVVVAVVVGA